MGRVHHSTKVLWLVAVGSVLLAHQAAKANFVFGESTKVPNINSSSNDFGPPVRLSSVNTSLNEESLTFAAGDSTLYFSRGDPYDPNRIPDPALATYDIWQVEVTPLVDFDGDGTLTLTDLTMLIDNWGTDSTLFDVGPMPLGDGKVDIEDLKVFITYLEWENTTDSQDIQ